jgi:hypothetical protein
LELLPAPTLTDTVSCDLFHACLDEKPDFEALSYTWGDPNDTIEISLHGSTHTITRNLDSAFRHLRYPDRSRVLWVDALCINQEGSIERAQQVSQMRHVCDVGGARRVVVWLGEEDNAKIALDFCEGLKAAPQEGELYPFQYYYGYGYDLELAAC